MKKIITFCYYVDIMADIALLFIVIKAIFTTNWINIILSMLLFGIIFIHIACAEMYDEPREQMIKFIDKYLK